MINFTQLFCVFVDKPDQRQWQLFRNDSKQSRAIMKYIANNTRSTLIL